jgi:hypothetical protein
VRLPPTGQALELQSQRSLVICDGLDGVSGELGSRRDVQ